MKKLMLVLITIAVGSLLVITACAPAWGGGGMMGGQDSGMMGGQDGGMMGGQDDDMMDSQGGGMMGGQDGGMMGSQGGGMMGSQSMGSGYIDGPTLVRVAEALELTPNELAAELEDGKTLADVAQNRDVPEDTLVTAIVAHYASQLELQVRDGYLTQERADYLVETAREHARSLLEESLEEHYDDD